jgi:hypothetical protein
VVADAKAARQDSSTAESTPANSWCFPDHGGTFLGFSDSDGNICATCGDLMTAAAETSMCDFVGGRA